MANRRAFSNPSYDALVRKVNTYGYSSLTKSQRINLNEFEEAWLAEQVERQTERRYEIESQYNQLPESERAMMTLDQYEKKLTEDFFAASRRQDELDKKEIQNILDEQEEAARYLSRNPGGPGDWNEDL